MRYWPMRLKLLWRFVRLIPKARELELDWQKAQQKRDDMAFAGKREDYLYHQGYCDGIIFCMKRFE